MVGINSLRLKVRSMLTLNFRTRPFRIVKSSPFEGFNYVLNRPFYFSLLVCVFYSENELTIVHSSKQIVKQGCPKATYVHVACRTGSIPHSHFIVCNGICRSSILISKTFTYEAVELQ